MEVPVEVPPIEGMSGEVATVEKWLKNEGDKVVQGEPIALLEFAKAELEVPAPASGTLSKIAAAEGRMVRIHDRIAVIKT